LAGIDGLPVGRGGDKTGNATIWRSGHYCYEE